jgi:hypothetical protein
LRIGRIAMKWRLTRSLGYRLARKELPESAKYCSRYGLTQEEIDAGSVLLFFVAFATSTLLLFVPFGYLSIFISLMIAYGFFSWYHNRIPRRIERERWIVSCETPLILQEIVLASAGSGSIFDLAKLVANGKHPIVSRVFSKIIQRVNNGDRPEKLVIGYANHQPCESLRRYLVDAVSLNLEWSEIRKILHERRGEAEFEYQKYTLQAETRILLIVGFGTFWPIIFSIGVFVDGLWRDRLSMLLMALLFSLVLYVLERRLMMPIKNVKILGGHDGDATSRGLLGHTMKEELQETVALISLMGEILHRENSSPEHALRRASETYQGWLSLPLSELTRSIQYNGETFHTAWLLFASRFSNPQCRQILGIVPRMIDKTSEIAGERLIEVASYIKENRVLVEERENILGAQRFKAKLLSLFSSAALGMVGALSPLFMIVSLQPFNLSSLKSGMWTVDTVFAVLVLLFMMIMNTLNTIKVVGVEKRTVHLLSCILVFLMVFTLSTRLIGGFF